MKESEVIIVDQIPDNDYESLIDECIRYALISKPFTIRRIGFQTLEKAILNIFKGKIAEALFKYFCEKNHITFDWESCSTPFWQIDNRDFLLNNYEWDIKTNFIYHKGESLKNHEYTDLPCLIPNRFLPVNGKKGDQWSTKDYIKNQSLGLDGAAYIFSFLKAADLLDNEKRGAEFYTFKIEPDQLNYIGRLETKYKGSPSRLKPFSEEWFWNEMSQRGTLEFIRLNFKPQLVITGYANPHDWSSFLDTGPNDKNNNWQTYLKSGWYKKTSRGGCNFMKGTLNTTITNATLPVSRLNSFLSLFPHLKTDLKCARIKQETN